MASNFIADCTAFRGGAYPRRPEVLVADGRERGPEIHAGRSLQRDGREPELSRFLSGIWILAERGAADAGNPPVAGRDTRSQWRGCHSALDCGDCARQSGRGDHCLAIHSPDPCPLRAVPAGEPRGGLCGGPMTEINSHQPPVGALYSAARPGRAESASRYAIPIPV